MHFWVFKAIRFFWGRAFDISEVVCLVGAHGSPVEDLFFSFCGKVHFIVTWSSQWWPVSDLLPHTGALHGHFRWDALTIFNKKAYSVASSCCACDVHGS